MAFVCSRDKAANSGPRNHRSVPPRLLPARSSFLIGSAMHALRQRAAIAFVARRRFLSDVARPWFVDPDPVFPRQLPPHLLPKTHDLPPDLPVPVKELFHTLSKSPYLELSTLQVKEPSPILPGPPLPKTIPKGRRGRGRTYSGEGTADDQAGIWNWAVTAQVRSFLKHPPYLR
jgi:hypothetical protein